MAVNCNLTESDYKAFRRFVMFQYRKMHCNMAAVLAPLMVLDWLSNKTGTPMVAKIAAAEHSP